MSKEKNTVADETSETATSKAATEPETVTIKLPKDKSSNADPRGVYVAVNGVAMFIPRNKEVTIPRAYYEVLMNASQSEDDADNYIENQQKNIKINI